MSRRLCIPLPEASGAAIVGGKAASLGELIRAGLPVPPGFAMTVDAFQAALAGIDPGGHRRAAIEALDASDIAAITTTTATLRDAIAATAVPGDVAEAVAAAYAALPGLDVAVRSSATMEDSAAASFAGLQDTYLGVHGLAGLLDAVRRCWASLYNDESVAYRGRTGLPGTAPSMAVVVQVMLSPRAAGVMFTRSPVSGDRSVVAIEGAWGLGSALVAGAVSPDSFTVSKITGEITARRISRKAIMESPGPRGAGPTTTDTPLPLRDAPCLSDDEIRALAGTARRVEEHYGVAQDIEWALLDGDTPPESRLFLLQSRPETAWAARDAATTVPLATPRSRPVDHILELFGKPS
ncbi:MAG TPA: PEP/pyruvate-binding domain-containing protein [Trebonia sp.]|nr:PEP/pyruvate-binding domain-containing protein [Trebonia sp.]